MALLWTEGFEKWGPSSAAPSPANVTKSKFMSEFDNVMTVVEGRYHGYAMRLSSTSSVLLTPDLNPQSRTLIVGANFKITNITNGAWVWDLRHPYNDGETIGYNQFTLRAIYVDANTYYLRMDRGGTALVSANVNMSINTWYAVEMKVYCHDTLGTANLWVDGSPVANFSGDTKHRSGNGTDRYSKVMLRTHVIPAHIYDDVYVMDDTGNTNNAPILDNWRIETLNPASDASGNWTPNTGVDMYAMVNEDTANNDTFITETTSGNRALFEMDNLTANGATGTIRGVMIHCEGYSRNRYAKVPKFVTQNGSGGTIQDGVDIVMGRATATPHCMTEVMETDPDGNAWTANTVNTFRLGIEVK